MMKSFNSAAPVQARRLLTILMASLLLGVTAGGLGSRLLRAAPSAARSAPPADNEYQVGAVLWQQSSGEWRALSYQAFSLARLMLDRDLRLHPRSARPRAIVVDVDETIMDNSRFQATLIKQQQAYDGKLWTEWVNRAEAAAMPGAVDFLNYATAQRARVFYITNRKAIEKEGTRTNLIKLGFPEVTNETLLVRTDEHSSSKEARRQSVSSRYRIVLLMGDNLNDFAEFLEKKTVADRIAAVEEHRAEFGNRFIVLPNPMYGDWENAIYDYNFRLTEAEKAAIRKQRLRAE
jgi:5'-nucleotidase (lipoprotein e(P4) family)